LVCTVLGFGCRNEPEPEFGIYRIDAAHYLVEAERFSADNRWDAEESTRGRIRLVAEDGGAEGGFLVWAFSATSLYSRLGLQGGDVVTHVDGRELRSINDGFEALKCVSRGRELVVELRRDGRPFTIHYTIE
jgi:hypothetical protein